MSTHQFDTLIRGNGQRPAATATTTIWESNIMNANLFIHELLASLGSSLPTVLGAIAVLLVGILLALVVRAVIRKGLNTLKLNERLGNETDTSIDVVKVFASIGFWFVFILTIVAMLNLLNLHGLSEPLSALAGAVMLYLPRILLALVLALIAWVLALTVRTVLNRVMALGGWDEKLSKAADVRPISAVISNVMYWLTLLLFLPAIVAALQIEGLMEPLKGMTTELTAALPNVFLALLIGAAGWLIARILRGLISNLLEAAGVDQFNDRVGLSEGMRLSQLGGTIAFILVIVPTIIAALDALKITAISEPATEMLGMFMSALPNLLAATLTMIVAWFLGQFIAGVVTRLLQNLGFDLLPSKLGLGHALDKDSSETSLSLSQLAGRIALFTVMLFATVESAHRIGFLGVRDLLTTFISFGGDILLGLVIFVIGYWLANLASEAIQRANRKNAIGLSYIAKFAILGLVIAMGLRAMGIADDVVNMAFGFVLGSAAVATAIAFGLGGREAAGKIANRWATHYLDNDKK